jgi:hypothetical protein
VSLKSPNDAISVGEKKPSDAQIPITYRSPLTGRPLEMDPRPEEYVAMMRRLVMYAKAPIKVKNSLLYDLRPYSDDEHRIFGTKGLDAWRSFQTIWKDFQDARKEILGDKPI